MIDSTGYRYQPMKLSFWPFLIYADMVEIGTSPVEIGNYQVWWYKVVIPWILESDNSAANWCTKLPILCREAVQRFVFELSIWVLRCGYFFISCCSEKIRNYGIQGKNKSPFLSMKIYGNTVFPSRKRAEFDLPFSGGLVLKKTGKYDRTIYMQNAWKWICVAFTHICT